MKIHHLCCGSMCPAAGRLLPSVFPAEVVCHCLLIESDEGLILVDTGLGLADMADPGRLGPMSWVMGVVQREEDAAIRQIERLGFDPRDVRHLVPTHLDLDHAGGIPDFPWAKIHTLRPEHEAATRPTGLIGKSRYRSEVHWNSETQWQVHELNFGGAWFGFDAVRQLPGLPPEVLLVPIAGHSAGHFGVAVQTDEGWLLHAGDSYYAQDELRGDGKTIFGWTVFQRSAHLDYGLARRNQARLRDLARNEPGVKIFPAHDPGRLRELREG